MNDEERNDEELIGQLLRPLDDDAAPLAANTIERISQQAGDLFSELGQQQLDTTPAASATNVVNVPTPQGRRSMITRVVLGLSAIAAGLFLMLQPPAGPDKDETLGAVLEKTLEVQNLKLTVDRDGNQAEVLISHASRVRWQDSPTKYRIASAAQMYEVDEQENKVRKVDSPWHLPDSQRLDLLSLLGIDGKQSQDLRQLIASEVETVDQKQRHVFTSTASDAVVHVWLDKSTGGLSELRCWPRGFGPNVQPIKLFVVARDIRVDESKFIVADTLSEDGRIGKVVDAQGVVTLRPMMNKRWTPVGRQMLLKPGDWVRTDARGANAATLILTSLYKVIVGPATLIELRSPTELKVHRGEIKIVGTKIAAANLKILGPRTSLESVAPGQTVHLRVDQEAGGFTQIDKKPLWLAGFEGSSNVDPVGSLLANIDGRDTPLTIGVHQVKVEIRDQIARTTIEESFVNHTGQRLEGIFHFPLPQDASISGFGMWINGELVEADVVEKQRAREIYETILREKRDPGLLEWTGGNIFKARVFPILPSSEKRIKIVYTQVLPLRANKYRYSYALRSEMLQKTPVRELSLDVQIYSALPLRSVDCPTHSVRTQQTTHAAKLEFEAQEYTPKRDFEVVCEVDSSGKDVVVVPHQRGDDGYFLVQLTPPGVEGNWQRELIADGDPLQILLVCDTSASMDSTMRKNQQQFVASILSGLSEEDRFDIAYCDVDCGWLHDEIVPPTAENVGAAAQWLADRVSLGWTNLDVMMKSVLDRGGEKTHVIYIGDGIVTAGDGDPQTFVNRLRRLTDQGRSGTFHAVSVGSSFESVVLKSVAAIGGGSVRKVDGEQTPERVAFELLNEIAQPGLRDLQVEFRGLRVAAVYPQRLPNLAAGTQQILIGRYLPEGEKQSGEIIVTGKRGDESVRYTTTISVVDAQSGNSFIPRLWARGHLDQLLSQGASQLIRDQIIALSEEFHIITPYTSLLVLESDADRERFGVQRRFEMRDGERFFAVGRDQANFALLQQQMKRAGDWRLALRRRVLAELTTLGRDTNVYQRLPAHPLTPLAISVSGTVWVTGGAMMRQSASSRSNTYLSDNITYSGGLGGGGLTGLGIDLADYTKDSMRLGGEFDALKSEDASKSAWDGDAFDSLDENVDMKASFEDIGRRRENLAAARQKMLSVSAPMAGPAIFNRGLVGMKSNKPMEAAFGGQLLSDWSGAYHGYDPYGNYGQYTSWVSQLFPTIPNSPLKWTPKQPADQADAVGVLKALIQQVKLADGAGLEVNRESQTFDPVWDRLTNVTHQLDLSAADRWLQFNRTAAANTHVHWCDAKVRGVYSRAFLLGRTRQATAEDLSAYQPGLRTLATAEQLSAYSEYTATILEIGDNETTVTLTYNDNDRVRVQITIDTNRNVVLSTQQWNNWEDFDSKPDSTTNYSQYKQVGGGWWPGKIETLDQDGQRTSLVQQKVKLLAAQPFAKRFDRELPDRERVLVLPPPMPTVRESHIAVRDGSADTAHRLTLILDAAAYQDWDAALKHLSALEELAAGKPCLPWIRISVLRIARKNNECWLQTLALADQLAAGGLDDELFLCEHLLGEAANITDNNEILRLLDRVSPVFARQDEHVRAPDRLQTRRAAAYRGLRRPEAIALQRDLAADAPWNFSAQLLYVHDLVTAGDHDAAIEWLTKQIDDYPGKSQTPLDLLRNRIASVLRELGRADDLVDYFEQWLEADPESAAAHQQYLTAMVMADRSDDADAIAARWIKEGQVPGKLDGVVHRRLTSGISYALGQRYQMYLSWTQPKWRQPLAETALFFLDSEHHPEIPQQIIGQSNFVGTDESDAVHKQIAKRLETSVATFDAQRVNTFVDWTVNRTFLTKPPWQKIAATIKQRWSDEQDRADRNHFAVALNSIYRTHFSDSDHLPFMRERITRAEADQEFPQDAAAFRRELFDVLIALPWQQEHEDEAATLVTRLGTAEDETSPLPEQLRGLMEFVDMMLSNRQAAAKQTLEATGRSEELTRSEYAEKMSAFLQAAREGVAATLAKHEDLDDELGAWIRLERMYLDLKLGRKLNASTTACWNVLGNEPEADPDWTAETLTHRQRVEIVSESLRRDRTLTMIYYLALRRGAPLALIDRLLKYVESGQQLPAAAGDYWRRRRYALLIGLDRPEQLQRELHQWIRDDAWPIDWQRSLARLEAERGKVDEAIGLIESVQKLTRLTSEDYAALADWYLVSDQRDAYKRAKIAVYEAMPEHIISNWLNIQVNRWWSHDQPLPTELDENVLFAFSALFAKSNQPVNYVYSLKRFYEACGDFRLLQMVPDSVIGRTSQQIYPMLERLSTELMPTIRKEATADEIVRRLDELRGQVDSPLDARALDLLETMIERQSAKVINQPGPHIERAVAAMKRAFKHEWADGEVRQMASFLASLATVARQDLRAERLRQFRELIAMTEPGSEDRFFVSWHTAHAIAWSDGDHDQGIVEMEIAIRDYRQLYPQGFPEPSNQAIFDYVRMLSYRNRFAEAERFLNQEIDHSLNQAQRTAYVTQRNNTYIHALRDRGQVDLGIGDELYTNLQKHLLDQADDAVVDGARKAAIDSLLKFYQTAADKNIAGAKEDFWTFAGERLGPMLKRQTADYENIVRSTMHTTVRLLGTLKALEFLIGRWEQYPVRLDYNWNSPWQQFGYKIAEWRRDHNANLGALEPRLLKLVLAELRRDLRTHHARARYMYGSSNNLFWQQQAPTFARVAGEIYDENPDSARDTTYIARYYADDLGRYGRAIEMMMAAYKNDRLSWDQQNYLVDFLHHEKLYAESIPILEPLVQSRPYDLGHRTELLTAYHRTEQPKKWDRLLAETDSLFRQEGRWIENAVSSLARVCLDNQHYAAAAEYYSAVIAIHKRTGHLRRQRDYYTLSGYYASQAQAYSGLGETQKAVDAASASIVTYGRDVGERRHMNHQLKSVLNAAKDLDAYVKKLDQQSDQTGQDNPLLRKMIGLVYADRNAHDKAITQLRLAIAMQPTDVETHQKLIEQLDHHKDAAGAIRQTLALLDVDRHNLQHYKKLAERLQDDAAMSERAFTTIVEAGPSESEHHQALAEIRQTQNRWDDAIDQWQQVAKLRSLEPDGLLKLAQAQINAKQTDAARKTLRKVSQTDWPARFTDVQKQVDQLRKNIKP